MSLAPRRQQVAPASRIRPGHNEFVLSPARGCRRQDPGRSCQLPRRCRVSEIPVTELANSSWSSCFRVPGFFTHVCKSMKYRIISLFRERSENAPLIIRASSCARIPFPQTVTRHQMTPDEETGNGQQGNPTRTRRHRTAILGPRPRTGLDRLRNIRARERLTRSALSQENHALPLRRKSFTRARIALLLSFGG